MKKLLFILIALGVTAFSRASDNPPSHETWNELLKEHVNEKGQVDYKGIKEDKSQFYAYLKNLTQHHPEESWSEKERMAYWINAYNAFTIQLIVKHYPVESIMKIGGAFEKPFDVKFIKIEGKKYSLNDIENNKLRAVFDEPRIHFAVNCASYSCPKLRNEAYSAANLDSQLQEQTVEFINNEKYNKLSGDQVRISKLFDWYKEDFTNGGSVIDFLNKYADITISEDAQVSYLKYNWSLNDQ